MHQLVCEVGLREELVATEADVTGEIVIVFFLMDILHTNCPVLDLHLLRKVECEDSVVIDLHKDWIAAMMLHDLAEWQLGSSQSEELNLFNIVFGRRKESVTDSA